MLGQWGFVQVGQPGGGRPFTPFECAVSGCGVGLFWPGQVRVGPRWLERPGHAVGRARAGVAE